MTTQFVLIARPIGFFSYEEMSARDEALCIYSDVYKSAHGFRPRGISPMVTAGQLHREIKAIERMVQAEREYNAQQRINRKLEAQREKQATEAARAKAMKREEFTLGQGWPA